MAVVVGEAVAGGVHQVNKLVGDASKWDTLPQLARSRSFVTNAILLGTRRPNVPIRLSKFKYIEFLD